MNFILPISNFLVAIPSYTSTSTFFHLTFLFLSIEFVTREYPNDADIPDKVKDVTKNLFKNQSDYNFKKSKKMQQVGEHMEWYLQL